MHLFSIQCFLKLMQTNLIQAPKISGREKKTKALAVVLICTSKRLQALVSKELESHNALGKRLIQDNLSSSKSAPTEAVFLTLPSAPVAIPYLDFFILSVTSQARGEQLPLYYHCKDTYLWVPFKNQIGLLIFMCSYLTPSHRRQTITFQLHRVIVTQHCWEKKITFYHNFFWMDKMFKGHWLTADVLCLPAKTVTLTMIIIMSGIPNPSWLPYDQDHARFRCPTGNDSKNTKMFPCIFHVLAFVLFASLILQAVSNLVLLWFYDSKSNSATYSYLRLTLAKHHLVYPLIILSVLQYICSPSQCGH